MEAYELDYDVQEVRLSEEHAFKVTTVANEALPLEMLLDLETRRYIRSTKSKAKHLTAHSPHRAARRRSRRLLVLHAVRTHCCCCTCVQQLHRLFAQQYDDYLYSSKIIVTAVESTTPLRSAALELAWLVFGASLAPTATF